MKNQESRLGKAVDYIAFLTLLGPFAIPLLFVLSPLIFIGLIVYYITVLRPMIK
jgi:hypothetical protein